MGKWNCRSTIVSFSTHKLTFTLRSRLYNRCALMGVSCYDTSNDEIVVKMKQFFKRNFIYICLATACLSLVRSNIKAYCWFNDCSIDWDWDGTRVIANGQGECFMSAAIFGLKVDSVKVTTWRTWFRNLVGLMLEIFGLHYVAWLLLINWPALESLLGRRK